MTTFTQLVTAGTTTTPIVGAGWRVNTITQYDVHNVPIASHTLTATAESYDGGPAFLNQGLYLIRVQGNYDTISFATLDDDHFVTSVVAGGSGVLPQVIIVQDIPLPGAFLLFALGLGLLLIRVQRH